MDVFVSYSSKDDALANSLCDIMSKYGFSYWIANENSKFGEHYSARIIDEIDGAKVFLLLITASSSISNHVINEVEHAFSNGKLVLPVNVGNVILSKELQYYLSSVHYVVYSEGEEFERLFTGRISELLGLYDRLENIYRSCNKNDILSIFSAWERYITDGCSPKEYSSYLRRLRNDVDDLISRTRDMQMLSSMLDKTEGYVGCEDIKPYLNAWTESIRQRISEEENKLRTYNGQVYESVEEAKRAAEEEKEIKQIMLGVSKLDIESVIAAGDKISGYTTKVKEPYLKTLEELYEEGAKRYCVFMMHTYATVEDARKARSDYDSARLIMDELNVEDQVMVRSAYNKLALYTSPSVDGFKAQLTQKLNEFDVRERTVDGITFATKEEADLAKVEFERINTLLSAMFPSDESSLLYVREELHKMTTDVREKYLTFVGKWLEQYDAEYRTYNGITYDSREEAEMHRREDKMIEVIMSDVVLDDLFSMAAAKGRLEKLHCTAKDEYIRQLDNAISDLDIKQRTFDSKVYPTKEEAQLAAREKAQAETIINGVSYASEESMLSALQELREMTTDVCAPYIKKVYDKWNEYDVKERTAFGELFDTREEARLSKDEMARFNVIITGIIKSFGDVLEARRFVSTELHIKLRPMATAMVNEVEQVISTSNSIIAEDARIDPAVNKKESEMIFNKAAEILPIMEKHGFDTARVRSLKDKHHEFLPWFKKVFK